MEDNELCEFCEGTKQVWIPTYDYDTHEWVYTDVKDCICVTGYPPEPELFDEL